MNEAVSVFDLAFFYKLSDIFAKENSATFTSDAGNTQFNLSNGSLVRIKRNLALKWFDESGAKYLNFKFAFADANFYSSYNQPKHFTADDVSVEEIEGLPEQVQISYGYASRTLTVALPYDCELPQRLLVYDLQGRVVLQHTLIKPVESISVATLPEGIYIVQVADHTMKIKINS